MMDLYCEACGAHQAEWREQPTPPGDGLDLERLGDAKIEYRGYVLRRLRDDLVDVVQPQLGRHASVEQAQRAIDHFKDRDCRAHRGECRG